MIKSWVYRPEPEAAQVECLQKALKVSPALAALLCQRRVASYDAAKAFFRPSLDTLPDPFQMYGMARAVDRLIDAIEGGERIVVYGDYDVDGTTAVALVYHFISRLYTNVTYYQPDRFEEGYGLSRKGVDFAARERASLLILLDCGIRAVEQVAYANTLGIDCLVCDHHEPDEQLPAACAILNPKQPACPYPFKGLSGCGVGFKFLQGYCQRRALPPELLWPYLDLVAVSIAADIVPITGENRTLAYFGLQQLSNAPRPGLRALTEVAGLTLPDQPTQPLTIKDIVFSLSPRLNAAGRMNHARHAVALLLAPDAEAAAPLARQLHAFNEERRASDQRATTEALAQLADQPNQRASVAFKEDWAPGVIGIVASRCTERYYRPTVVLTRTNGHLTGSVRSVANFDVHAALADCADLLMGYGGHAAAAGLRLAPEKYAAFRERFEAAVARRQSSRPATSDRPPVEIDLPLRFADITPKFWRILRQFEPFGPGNLSPVFVSEGVTDAGSRCVGKSDPPEHLRFRVQQGDSPVMEGIGFGLAHHLPQMQEGHPFRMCYSLESDTFRGRPRLQLRVYDVRFDE